MTRRPPDIPTGEPEPLIAGVCELIVLRALELAGKRIPSRRGGRSLRACYRNVPPWEIHTIFPARSDELDKLLENAWTLPLSIGVPASLIEALNEHVRVLLVAGLPFNRADLRLSLSRVSGDATRLPWTG